MVKRLASSDQNSTDLTNVRNLTLVGQASPTYAAGKIVYDTGNDSFTAYNSQTDMAMQIGQETYIRARNATGSTIGNGIAVYINGSNTSLPSIGLAKADSLSTAYAVGISTQSIATATTGFVTAIGLVRNIDTSAFSAGQLLYVSAATAGALTATVPANPNYVVPIAVCIVSNASTGVLQVINASAQPNVKITVGTTTPSSPATGDLWVDTN